MIKTCKQILTSLISQLNRLRQMSAHLQLGSAQRFLPLKKKGGGIFFPLLRLLMGGMLGLCKFKKEHSLDLLYVTSGLR